MRQNLLVMRNAIPEGLDKNIVKSKKITDDMAYKFKKYVECLSGHQFRIEFESPTVLQIDGESIENVKEFKVSTKLLKYV